MNLHIDSARFDAICGPITTGVVEVHAFGQSRNHLVSVWIPRFLRRNAATKLRRRRCSCSTGGQPTTRLGVDYMTNNRAHGSRMRESIESRSEMDRGDRQEGSGCGPARSSGPSKRYTPVSYTHLRAHET